MSLPDRLNQIIKEQNLSKAEFAKRIGVSENYIYILTGKRGKEAEKPMNLSTSLAKLISLQFGYSEKWILHGSEE